MQVEEAALRRTVSKEYRRVPQGAQGYADGSGGEAELFRQIPSRSGSAERVCPTSISSRASPISTASRSATSSARKSRQKEDRPRFHMFILILSIALTFAVATLIFFLFVVFAIPYRAWLFFIYAIPVASIPRHRVHEPLVGACSGRGSPRRCSSGRWACRSICRCPYRIWS